MTDFNLWLQTEYDERRARNPNFSLRAFARHLKISPAQLSQLLSGKRNLTGKMARQILDALDTSPSEKRKLLHHLSHLDFEENRASHKRLEEDQFRLISDWYHFAILSLTRVKNAKADPRWISAQLGISITEARQACDRLVRLGILEMKPKFRQVSEPLEVASHIPSAAIQKFHKQVLQLATEKLETASPEIREFQSMILAIHPAKIPLAKKMIDDAVNSITETLEGKDSSEVYAFSVQFIPLTRGENIK